MRTLKNHSVKMQMCDKYVLTVECYNASLISLLSEHFAFKWQKWQRSDWTHDVDRVYNVFTNFASANDAICVPFYHRRIFRRDFTPILVITPCTQPKRFTPAKTFFTPLIFGIINTVLYLSIYRSKKHERPSMRFTLCNAIFPVNQVS